MAFFFTQPVVGKEDFDLLGRDGIGSLLQAAAKLLDRQMGMLDRFHQDRNGNPVGRQLRGGSPSAAVLDLLAIDAPVCGEIDEGALDFLPSERRVMSERGEEGARGATQDRAELGRREAGRRMRREMHDGLCEVPVGREEDVAIPPDPVGIELGYIGQGVVPSVLVVAGAGIPDFQEAADGNERAA